MEKVVFVQSLEDLIEQGLDMKRKINCFYVPQNITASHEPRLFWLLTGKLLFKVLWILRGQENFRIPNLPPSLDPQVPLLLIYF